MAKDNEPVVLACLDTDTIAHDVRAAFATKDDFIRAILVELKQSYDMIEAMQDDLNLLQNRLLATLEKKRAK